MGSLRVSSQPDSPRRSVVLCSPQLGGGSNTELAVKRRKKRPNLLKKVAPVMGTDS